MKHPGYNFRQLVQVWASFLLYIYALDFSFRFYYLSSQLSPKELFYSTAGTIIGIYASAVLFAIVFIAIAFILIKISLTKQIETLYYFTSGLMISALYVIFFTITYRYFNLTGVIGFATYQKFTISSLIVLLLMIFATRAREGLKTYLFSSIVISERALSAIFLCCLLVVGVASAEKALNKHYVSQKRGEADRPNVILVIIDGLSYGHTSMANYVYKTTPNMEKFARENYCFNGMISPVPSTVMALTNIFGSNKEHLASLMRDAGGYDAHAIHPDGFERIASSALMGPFDSSHNYLYKNSSLFNLPQEFELLFYRVFGVKTYLQRIVSDYLTNRVALVFPSFRVAHYEEDINYRLKEILDSKRCHQFIWMHYFSVHEYARSYPPAGLSGKFPNKNKVFERYDEMVSFVDNCFGQLIEYLKEKHLYDNSLIILTADHGLTQDSYYTSKYDVPLLMHVPGQAKGRKVAIWAETADIAPTILDVLSLPIPSWVKGESLVKYINGKKQKGPIYSYCLLPEERRGADKNYEEIIVCQAGYRLIYNLEKKSIKLYNIKSDPREERDLSEENTKMAAYLKALILNKL